MQPGTASYWLFGNGTLPRRPCDERCIRRRAAAVRAPIALPQPQPAAAAAGGRHRGTRSRYELEEEDLSPEERALRAAHAAAERKTQLAGDVLWFLGVTTLLLIFITPIGVIVLLFWGLKVAKDVYELEIEPRLRRRFVEQEVEKQVHASLSQQRLALEGEHARSLEQLSASIAHEIRNPITAAKSLVQQMGETPTARENVDYARVALEELQRVERSVSHLLRFAREEEGGMAEVSMADVVESTLESFRERAQRSGIRAFEQRRENPYRNRFLQPLRARRIVQHVLHRILVRRSAEHQDRMSTLPERPRDRGEALRRPSFGRTVRGAGLKGDAASACAHPAAFRLVAPPRFHDDPWGVVDPRLAQKSGEHLVVLDLVAIAPVLAPRQAPRQQPPPPRGAETQSGASPSAECTPCGTERRGAEQHGIVAAATVGVHFTPIRERHDLIHVRGGGVYVVQMPRNDDREPAAGVGPLDCRRNHRGHHRVPQPVRRAKGQRCAHGAGSGAAWRPASGAPPDRCAANPNAAFRTVDTGNSARSP